MYNTGLVLRSAIDSCKKQFDVKNVHALPMLEKVTLSFNLGSSGTDKKVVESAVKDMLLISGLKPVVGIAKFSSAPLKIREGQPISVYVTLRGAKMLHFLDRFIYVALPRIRDFRGLKRGFDKLGSFTCTVKGGSSIMYEVNFSNDLNVCMNFKNSDAEKSAFILEKIKIPFIN